MTLFLRNRKTSKVYEIVSLDRTTGKVVLKGSLAQFEDTFDKALYKRMGYELVEAENAEQAAKVEKV